MRMPLILSRPHGGLAVPPEIRSRVIIDQAAVYNDCDLWVDELFDFSHPDLWPSASRHDDAGVLATVSTAVARVFVDANRRPDDLDNPDGPVKTQTSYGAPIYDAPPSDAEKLSLLERYWQPYHDQLAEAIARHRSQARLLLDCHNMAQHSPSAYQYPGAARPLICLSNLGDGAGRPVPGLGWTSCPADLLAEGARLAQEIFADLTLLEPTPGEQPPVVAINWPFKGGYVLERHTSPGLPAIMIEVNRGLFVGDQDATRGAAMPDAPRIGVLRRRLHQWAQQLVGCV